MLQSVFRPLSNHLTTNWPILWAARLDVALGCGLLLLVFGVPIFWLGRDPLQQKWGTAELGSILSIIATLMATGALVLWVISVGRVYVRGMSPQMSQCPRFIDILLGTILIVTPTMILSLVAASNMEPIGFNLKFVPLVIASSVALSTMLAFILMTILRSSMRVALLSFIGIIVLDSLFESLMTSVVTRWFPSPPDKTANVTITWAINGLTCLAVIASLIWIVSGTARVRARERLITIGFPTLFPFVWSANDVVLRLLGLAVIPDKPVTDLAVDYVATYSNPLVAFIDVPFALAIAIVLGEVLSRRWARLTLMPK
jgi:hypothetical protein